VRDSQVGKERNEDEGERGSEHDCRERWHIPRYARVVTGPSEPEHGTDEERSSEDSSVKSVKRAKESVSRAREGSGDEAHRSSGGG
jgi:hypothetical protein